MNYKITIQHSPLLSIIVLICFSLFLQAEETSLNYDVYFQSKESSETMNSNKTTKANLVVMPSAIDFGNVHIHHTSDVMSYTLTGFDLTSDVAITAPYPFQVSLNENTGFTSSLNIPGNVGTISTEVYVRMHPSATSEYSGAIIHTTVGLLPVSVALSGTGVETSIEVNPVYLDLGEVMAGGISEPQAYLVSYKNLIEDLVITSSSDRFEISLSKHSGFGSSITIPASPLNKKPTEVTYQDGYNVVRGERPPIDLNNVPKDAYEPGKMFIKLKPHIGKSLPARRLDAGGEGYAITGISFLDTLNRQFGVTAYKPMFAALYNTNSRSLDYRERHETWGFHLWFELVVDEDADIIEAVKSFNLREDIEIAELVYKTRQNNYQDQKEANTFLPVEPNKTDEKPDGKSGWSPNDPYYSSQWHYNNTGQSGGTPGADISLEKAWEIEKGHPDVIVAVVDGGIQSDHPDLADNIWEGIGYNFYHDSPNIIPHNHGTHVAGTVAAVSNNSILVAGVAGGSGSDDGVRLMSCQNVIDSITSGSHLAMVYAADNGAAVSQNSWSYIYAGYYNQSVLDAIDYFNLHGGGDVLHGGITVFSAGNKNDNGNYYPGFYSGSLSVAATNNQDKKAYFGNSTSGSNYGTWIDISAPGGETYQVNTRGVLSTITNNSYYYYQGTSMAAPHVSGVAALLISYAHRNGITLRNTDVLELLINNTDDIYDVNPEYIGMLGSGRLNAHKALMALKQQATVWVRFLPESPGAAHAIISNSSHAYNETMEAHGVGITYSFNCGDQITDNQGNVYNTVQIGDQCWMAENLNYQVSDSWCYNYNTENCDNYGRLYTWQAAMAGASSSNSNPSGVQGVCPTGWHIPSHSEWTQLTNYTGGTSSPHGNKLKSCRQINSPLGGDCNTTEHPRWNSHNTHYGTDDFGFSALPGGERTSSGTFQQIGGFISIWSATQSSSSSAYRRFFHHHRGSIGTNSWGKGWGYYVRCIKTEEEHLSLPEVSTAALTAVTSTSARAGGNVTDDGGTQVTARGVVWNTEGNPSVDDFLGYTIDGAGTGEFSSTLYGLSPSNTYYVRAYATNSAGTAYGNQVSFTTLADDYIPGTVTDIDGNIYQTVIIGNQEWMAENLRVTRLNNEDDILTGFSIDEWVNNTEAAYVIYPNSSINGLDSDDEVVAAYGKLYNGFAVMDTRGLCPEGWSVPGDDDWTQLIDYLIDLGFPNSYAIHAVGNALKSCRQVGSPFGDGCDTSSHPRWDAPPHYCDDHYGFNEFGFSALPGGYRYSNGIFSEVGISAIWWSSTDMSPSRAWNRNLFRNDGIVRRYYSNYSSALSVRCFRDVVPEPTTYNLILEFKPSGAGIVNGEGEYEEGQVVNILAIPTEGWEFDQWTGDTYHLDDPYAWETSFIMPDNDVNLTANFTETGISEHLLLSNETIPDGDTECFNALQTIIVSDFTVEAGGSSELIAGQSIHLLPGTTVEHGGYLLARIAQHEDDYCGSPRATEIVEEPVRAKEDLVYTDFPHEVRENGFFKLYPNPTDGTFTLELTTAELEQTITVEVHTMLGGRLFSKELPSQRLHTLSLEGQQPGMYIIRVMKGDKVGVERLIKR